jgi:transglutaminase-like putative cysteine protease
MRIRISHATTYRYDAPPGAVTQLLRLTPRNHDGQYVASWRIDLSRDATLHQHEDAFGNITHTFTADGPFGELTVTVDGEVDTTDTHGVVGGALERFPPSLYLRETPLTASDPAIGAFADGVREKAGPDMLGQLHALLREINGAIIFDTDPTRTTTTAAEAFALGRGVCQDITHVFIAAARHLGFPARYDSGYLLLDGQAAQVASHAWSEAHVEGLGWVGFDAANGISPDTRYVRLATGRDYRDAMPVSGIILGTAAERLAVRITVEQ